MKGFSGSCAYKLLKSVSSSNTYAVRLFVQLSSRQKTDILITFSTIFAFAFIFYLYFIKLFYLQNKLFFPNVPSFLCLLFNDERTMKC